MRCIEREILIMIMIVIWFYNLRKTSETRPRRNLKSLWRLGKFSNWIFYHIYRMLAKWLLGVDYHFQSFLFKFFWNAGSVESSYSAPKASNDNNRNLAWSYEKLQLNSISVHKWAMWCNSILCVTEVHSNMFQLPSKRNGIDCSAQMEKSNYLRWKHSFSSFTCFNLPILSSPYIYLIHRSNRLFQLDDFYQYWRNSARILISIGQWSGKQFFNCP